jgi:RNA polymerase sigma-70 factor (ECF subfamily)
MIRNTMASEDIVQNVFIKLYENIGSIRNRNSIKYWLFTTTRNEVMMVFRKKKSHLDQFNVSDINEIDIISNDLLSDEIEKKELKELILYELDKMSDEHKEVFYLKEYGELSYKEIAELMKISEELVKSRLYNTRQRLISKLKKIVTK